MDWVRRARISGKGDREAGLEANVMVEAFACGHGLASGNYRRQRGFHV